MSELTELIEGMMDSLDESVTHEDIYRVLMEALELSRRTDKLLEVAIKVAFKEKE